MLDPAVRRILVSSGSLKDDGKPASSHLIASNPMVAEEFLDLALVLFPGVIFVLVGDSGKPGGGQWESEPKTEDRRQKTEDDETEEEKRKWEG